MDNHEGGIRAFFHTGKAYYGDKILKYDEVDEIFMGIYHHEYDDEYGTSGEFRIVWKKFSGDIVARLDAYEDGWSALSKFPEVLEWMAEIDNEHIDADEFADKLREFGIVDKTKYERP